MTYSVTETDAQIIERLTAIVNSDRSALQHCSPVEIDTVLSRIWEREANAQMRIANYKRGESEIYATIEKIKSGARLVQYRTALDGIELMEKLALLGRHIVAEGNKLAAAQAEALPYETEYVRRGTWTRVFLAKSHDGHAHNGRKCSTCHHGETDTDFAWLVEYSGKPEVEIVADAGERACTTCYKTAPVNAKGTKMFTPDEIEVQKAREEREAAKAERARQADIKGITTPEGLPLDIGGNGFKDIAKTLRTAEIAATDFLVSLLQEKRYAATPSLAWMYENGTPTEKRQAKHAHMAWWVIRAVAAKKGQTFEETFQVHMKKAEAKIRKYDREWAKDPSNPNRSK